MPVPSAFETASFAHQKRMIACDAFAAFAASSSSSGRNTPAVNSSERSRATDSTSTPTRAFAAARATTNWAVCAIAMSIFSDRSSPHLPSAWGLPESSRQIWMSASLQRAWW